MNNSLPVHTYTCTAQSIFSQNMTSTGTPITLHANGERAIVSEAEADAILERWKTELAAVDNPRVVTLDLSCRAWKRSILEKIRPFLEEHVVSTVETLQLDDMTASLPTEEGLDTLQFIADVFGKNNNNNDDNNDDDAPNNNNNNNNLKHLFLDDCAVGTRGFDILRPLIRNHSQVLQTISFRNCGLAAECFDADRPLFDEPMSQIRRVELGQNQIGVKGAQGVAQMLETFCPHLESFAYDGARPQPKGTKYLMQALANITAAAAATTGASSLKSLNLNDCTLQSGDEDEHPVHDLVQVLNHCANLQVLDLSNCGLQEGGLQLVLEALQQGRPTALRVLNLSGNELETQGAEHLAAYLENNESVTESLEELILDSNDFEDEGLEHLLGFLRTTKKLKVLDLSSNLLMKESAIRLLDQRLICPLTTFNLTDNELSVKTVARLRKIYPFLETDEDNDLGEDSDEEEQVDEDVEALTKDFEKM